MSGSIRIVDMPDLGAFTSNSSIVGEHAGSGRFSQAGLSAYYAPRWLEDVRNVRDFGAKGDGVTDDTAAIRVALAADPGGTFHNVYLPAGIYKLTNSLTVSAGRNAAGVTTGQCLLGDNKAATQIVVGYDFSPSASAVIILTGNGNGTPCVESFGIQFKQPSGLASRANFDTLANGAGANGKGVKYPPAIDMSLANNGRVVDVWIGGAWTGVYANWNLSNGETQLINIDCGAFYRGLDLTHSQGIIHANNYHFYPWGIPEGGNNLVYRDGNTYAAYLTDNQGLTVSNFFSQYGRLAITGDTLWNPTAISNLQMDGADATTEISTGPGIVTITGGYSTGSAVSPDTSAQLQVSGGSVKLTSYDFMGSNDSTKPMIAISGGTLAVSSCRIAVPGPASSGVVQSGGQLTFTGNIVDVDSPSTWTAPLISITGGTYTITGNTFAVVGGGAGTAISSSADGPSNVVMDNSYGYAWTFTPPGPIGSYTGWPWASWTPTLTAQTGTLGSYTASGRYQRVGKLVTVHAELVLTSIGTAAGWLGVGLPIGADNTINAVSAGLDPNDGAVIGTAQGNVMEVVTHDALTVIKAGHTILLSASYVAT